MMLRANDKRLNLLRLMRPTWHSGTAFRISMVCTVCLRSGASGECCIGALSPAAVTNAAIAKMPLSLVATMLVNWAALTRHA